MDLPPSRHRWALLVLVFGLVLAAGPLVSNLPEDRRVLLHLERPEDVERVELMWLDEGREPIRSTTLPFGTRGAPQVIERRVALRNGQHTVAVTVWREGRPEHEERAIDVADEASEITLRLSASRRP